MEYLNYGYWESNVDTGSGIHLCSSAMLSQFPIMHLEAFISNSNTSVGDNHFVNICA